jgi:hypothetical protein
VRGWFRLGGQFEFILIAEPAAVKKLREEFFCPGYDMTISKEGIQDWLETIATWLGVGLYPVVMIGSVVRALVIMLIAALFGLIFNSSCNARLSYAGLLRLAALVFNGCICENGRRASEALTSLAGIMAASFHGTH